MSNYNINIQKLCSQIAYLDQVKHVLGKLRPLLELAYFKHFNVHCTKWTPLYMLMCIIWRYIAHNTTSIFWWRKWLQMFWQVHFSSQASLQWTLIVLLFLVKSNMKVIIFLKTIANYYQTHFNSCRFYVGLLFYVFTYYTSIMLSTKAIFLWSI